MRAWWNVPDGWTLLGTGCLGLTIGWLILVRHSREDLGILGLSPAVCISGKLVTPATMADLHGLVADLRIQEKKLQGAARAAKPGGTPFDTAEAVNLVGPGAYAAYVDKAKESARFTRRSLG